MVKKRLRKNVVILAKRKKSLVDNKGFDSEFIKNHLIEEMAELIQAINKVRRTEGKDPKRVNNLYEEAADVYIGMHELFSLLEDKKLLNDYIEEKLAVKNRYLDKWEDKVS